MELRKYFNNNDQDISNNLKKKEKCKKVKKKRRQSMFNGSTDKKKYELMLKRILEQKKVKRNGPKRRDTIRKEDDKIKSLINEILTENKNEIKNSTNSTDNSKSLNINSSTLIIKNQNNLQKLRFSSTIDRNRESNIVNKKVVKNLINQNFKNVNTLNEVIREGNGSSGLGKKETNKK